MVNPTNFYVMTPDRMDFLWENAEFIFDTNAFCAMYRMTESAKLPMLDILEYFKGRIWVPAHVLYEYTKNRNEVIVEPIAKKYQNPEFFNNNYAAQVSNFIEKLKKEPYYHPYFDDEALQKLEEELKNASAKLKDIKDLVGAQIQKRKTEIINQKAKDIILEKVMSLTHGRPFSHLETIEIMKEGEFRHRNMLPPGYIDWDSKVGVQKYGDLIIWKEILQHAKESCKPVIIISNDVKPDWYEEHQKNEDPTTPRHELITEFIEETGKDMWMLTLNQFVNQLEFRYKDTGTLPFYEGLEAVKISIAYSIKKKEYAEKMKKAHWLRCACDKCKEGFTVDVNDFDFEWEAVGWSDRGMGEETEYNCQEFFVCPHCGNDCEVTLKVWEYPVGAYNYEDIEAEGCIVHKEDIDLSKYISFTNREQCEQCGSWEELDELGMCEACARRLREKMNKDD